MDNGGSFSGLYEGMPFEEYRRAPGLNQSSLKKFAISPAHFKAYQEEERKQTNDQAIFTAVHMAILEPDLFKTDIAIIDGHRGSKDVKTKIAEAERTQKLILKQVDYERVVKAQAAVLSHQLANRLIKDGMPESSIFWEENGILWKIRPDFLRNNGDIVDVKCFYDLRTHNLESQIYKSRYHHQAYIYMHGVSQVFKKSCHFYFLFVETKPPYGVRVVELSEGALGKAAVEISPLVARYKECFEKDEWPNYSEELGMVSLPSYVTN